MKKRNIKSLNLNKKYISSFETESIKGGAIQASGAETCGGQTSSYPPTRTCQK
jgi:hypothetical protein